MPNQTKNFSALIAVFNHHILTLFDYYVWDLRGFITCGRMVDAIIMKIKPN